MFRRAGRVDRALDLGAGTGLSTRALLPFANLVVGIDPSAPMLGAAPRAQRTFFVRARAESLPFPSCSFGLAAIGCAFHWCDRDRLFAEVDRVLSPRGWLGIYDSDFMGLADSCELLEWLRGEYWSRLPWCPHNPLFDPASHLRPPFQLEAALSVEAHVRMTLEGVVHFVTTQASTINAVTSGLATLPELEARLRDGLRSFFASTSAALMRFANPL